MFYEPMMDGTAGWWWLLGDLFFLVLIGAVVAVVVLLVNRSASRTVIDSPTEIAKQRYARGEITKEQFEQIKADVK